MKYRAVWQATQRVFSGLNAGNLAARTPAQAARAINNGTTANKTDTVAQMASS